MLPVEDQLQEGVGDGRHVLLGADLAEEEVQAAAEEGLVAVFAGDAQALEQLPQEDGVIEPETLQQGTGGTEDAVGTVLQLFQPETAFKALAYLRMIGLRSFVIISICRSYISLNFS